MTDELTYLPPRKREDLQRLAAMIRDRCCAVGFIILFGSYARGDWKEAKDLAPDRKSGHASDYDILAITEHEDDCTTMVWQEIAAACQQAGLSATARIIHHDISFVNRKLELGQYFFSDIVAEGRVLYDSGTLKLAQRRTLTPTERLEVAREYYAHWFERAERFNELHKISLGKGWLNESAFNMHQAAETAYKTVLLVFTGYSPDEHFLGILSANAAQVDPAFADLLQPADDFQRDAFSLLEYAYIGARYDRRYTIDEPSVLFLADRVTELLRLTREKCWEKIETLKNAAGV